MWGSFVAERYLVAVVGRSGSRGSAYQVAPVGVSGSTPVGDRVSPRAVRPLF